MDGRGRPAHDRRNAAACGRITARRGQQRQTANQCPSEDAKPRLRRTNCQEYHDTIRELPGINIRPIAPDTRGDTTMRERLIKHQNVATCAVCHPRTFPPGFALEALNPVGEFRIFYRDDTGGDTLAIETRVTLHSGESVQDLRE